MWQARAKREHAYKLIRRREVVHSWGELIKTSHMTRALRNVIDKLLSMPRRAGRSW